MIECYLIKDLCGFNGSVRNISVGSKGSGQINIRGGSIFKNCWDKGSDFKLKVDPGLKCKKLQKRTGNPNMSKLL